MKTTYQLIKERVKALEEENERLQTDLDQANSTASMYAKRCIKAIEYINQLPFTDLVPLEVKVINKILQGEDND